MRMTLTPAVGLAAAAIVLLGACGDASGPGGNGGNPDLSNQGYVQAFMSDDPSTTSPAQAAPLLSRAGAAAASFNGSMSATVDVAIQAEGGAWVTLGPPRDVNVAFQSTGSRTDLSGRVLVPVGTYTRVRLTMTGAESHVLAGATIGGTTLTVDADLVVGGTDGTVVVEYAVPPFTVEANASVETALLFELNSESWVTEAALQAGVIADAAVQSGSRCEPKRQPASEDGAPHS